MDQINIHDCALVVCPDHITDEQMVELGRMCGGYLEGLNVNVCSMRWSKFKEWQKMETLASKSVTETNYKEMVDAASTLSP